MPKVYVGIPCYGESERLRQTVDCLRATMALDCQLDVQIERQSVVQNKNAILSRARISNAEFVAFCDDDVEPSIGWDRDLISGIEEVEKKTGRRVGQTTPQLILPDGRVFALWFNACLGAPAESAWIDSAGYNLQPDPGFNVFVVAAAVAGTLTVFRREVLDVCEWQFDDRYDKSQWEDIDQSLACRSAGFEVVYNGHVRVTHHVTGASPRSGTENRLRLMEKWGGRSELSRIVTEEMARNVSHDENRCVVGGEERGMARADWQHVMRELSKNPGGRLREGVKVLINGGWGALMWRLRARRHGLGR